MKSLWDLNDDTTLELGASYVAGNNTSGQMSFASGGHLIVKWKPARHATTRSAVFTTEAIAGDRANGPGAPHTKAGGLYSYLQWQLARRWFVAGRWDYLGLPADDTGIARRGSAILVYAPTEFSAIRFQASRTYPPFGADPVNEGFVQMNFTLGAHPAHAY